MNKIHVSTRCLTVMLPDSCQIIRLRCFISSQRCFITAPKDAVYPSKKCGLSLQKIVIVRKKVAFLFQTLKVLESWRFHETANYDKACLQNAQFCTPRIELLKQQAMKRAIKFKLATTSWMQICMILKGNAVLQS